VGTKNGRAKKVSGRKIHGGRISVNFLLQGEVDRGRIAVWGFWKVFRFLGMGEGGHTVRTSRKNGWKSYYKDRSGRRSK